MAKFATVGSRLLRLRLDPALHCAPYDVFYGNHRNRCGAVDQQ